MELSNKSKDILKLSNEESNKISRECLQTAIIRLMAYKKLEDITITELVKEAGVSRNAFYRNYSSKKDIILELCNSIINITSNLITSSKDKKLRYKYLQNLFFEIKENSQNFMLLFQARVYNFEIINEDEIAERILETQSIEEQYHILAAFFSIYAIIYKWLKNGMQEDIEFMTNVCCDILNKFFN